MDSGTSWELVGEPLDDLPVALISYNGSLVVGGRFNLSDGAVPHTIRFIAQLVGSTWQQLGVGLGTGTGGYDNGVLALAAYQGQLIACGNFGPDSPGTPWYAAWDGQAWRPLPGGPTVPSNSLLVSGGELFSAGNFQVQAWNGVTTRTLDISNFGEASSLIALDGSFAIGGNFATVGGSLANDVALLHQVGHADFDGDGVPATDQDVEAFFACLAGNCCDACGSADFDGDGDMATDADIEAFFRVLAGGSC